MTARAIWKGNLVLGKHEVPVKVYSAVQDQAVHFHLLHEKDLTPVEQRIVRKDNGREVPKEAQRKALPLDDQRAVILEPDELEKLEPESDRAIQLLRFVPRDALGDQWFDRPYFLGPDDDERRLLRPGERPRRQGPHRHRPLGHARQALPRRAVGRRRLPGHDDASARRAGAGRAGDPAGQGAHAVRRPK